MIVQRGAEWMESEVVENEESPMSTIAIVGGHGKVALLLARELAEAGHTPLGVIRDESQGDDVRAAGAAPVVVDIESATAEELAAAIGAEGTVDAIVFAAGAGGGSGAARKESVDHQGSVKSIAAAGILGARRF